MNINTRQLKKWIEALDSGKYKQAKHTLQNSFGYCCLGVACEVIIPKCELKLVDGFIYGDMPTRQPNCPAWLIRISNDFKSKTGVLIDVLNDSGVNAPWDENIILPEFAATAFSFTEIATLLELVYIHKILD